MKHAGLIVGLLAGIALTSRSSEAQYTADFQTNIISGVTSNWAGSYAVGSNTFADVLVIQNGGVLTNWFARVGYEVSSSNNGVSVTGIGSIWSNGSALFVGNRGAGNSLVISNGGRAVSPSGRLGVFASSSNNVVLVTGPNSLWQNSGSLSIGATSGNSLIISNGACVVNGDGNVGFLETSTSNIVMVTGVGSVWSNLTQLYVGYEGTSNRLTISAGGQVFNGIGYVSHFPNSLSRSSSNSVLVTDSGSVWSNKDDLIVGYFGRNSELVISNGGRVFNHYGYIGGFYYPSEKSSTNNTVSVTGQGSVWNTSDLSVGYFGASNNLIVKNGGQVVVAGNLTIAGMGGSGNSLVISNGGQVIDVAASVGGFYLFGSNNVAFVTGSGSVWSNSQVLCVGNSGAGNSMVINRSGTVYSAGGVIGSNTTATGNSVLVTDSGSVWVGYGGFYIGGSGSKNSLVISNSGQVVNSDSYVGYESSSSNNDVRVTIGGVWQNNTLRIGQQGSSNSLVIAGGTVVATNLVVGFGSTICTNLLRMDSGNVIVTNAAGDAVFEVRRGKLVLNGGTLQVDRFVMTNACAQFVRTGGTLIYGTAVLDPNRDDDGDGVPNGWEQAHGLDPLNAADANVDSDGDGFTNLQEFLAGTDPTNSASAFRITSVARTNNDVHVTWTMGSGKTNALQAAAGASYTTNFADIFIVTNTVGSVTNYLDVGGATNLPARYYRVRLVP